MPLTSAESKATSGSVGRDQKTIIDGMNERKRICEQVAKAIQQQLQTHESLSGIHFTISITFSKTDPTKLESVVVNLFGISQYEIEGIGLSDEINLDQGTTLKVQYNYPDYPKAKIKG